MRARSASATKTSPTKSQTRADFRVDVQLAWRGNAAGDTPDTPDEASIRDWARAALGEATQSVCIRVVDETESRALNAKFRLVDHATNVLSFPADVEGILGDIAICGPVVNREAAAQGKRPAAHFAHMVVHGVLHLKGMDHQNDDDAKAMEENEAEILACLGVANPYET